MGFAKVWPWIKWKSRRRLGGRVSGELFVDYTSCLGFSNCNGPRSITLWSVAAAAAAILVESNISVNTLDEMPLNKQPKG